MITNRKPKDWNDLQQKVAETLQQCGFQTEIEKTIPTVRGNVEVDVYAEETVKGRTYSIICECKHWKANIPQTIIHGFRTIVTDIGCNIGYIITMSDFQSGGVIASDFTNVKLLTWEQFLINFFPAWYETYFLEELRTRFGPLLTYLEPILPKWFSLMTEDDKNRYLKLRDEYQPFGSLVTTFWPYSFFMKNPEIPLLPLLTSGSINDFILDNISNEILEETGFAELLEKLTIIGTKALADFRVLRDRYHQS
jgi:restriction system protein